MADFSSTKSDAHPDEWKEQLDCMVELNGFNPEFIPDSWCEAYDRGDEVSDFFYANYDVED